MATGPGYRIEIVRPALKQLEDLPQRDKERVRDAIDGLAGDPRPQGYTKLKGTKDQYRIVIGSYRVIYGIVDDRLIVLVLKIGDRKDVYRRKR